jgi:flagellar hook protein FlgE
MSILGAMFSGVSGLTAQSQALGAIADNITNQNTIGYKATEVRFQTLVTAQASQNNYSPGGVQQRPFASVDVQGLFNTSTNPTDLALSGSGFFVTNVGNSNDGTTGFNFTRAGAFNADKSGFLKNTAGFFLQAYRTDSTGQTLDSDGAVFNPDPTVFTNLETVRLNNIGGTADATDNLTFGANLPAEADVGGTNNTTIQVFDSLGVAHNLSLVWTKVANNQWDLAVEPPTNSATAILRSPANLVFAAVGRLDITAAPADGEIITVNFGVGAGVQNFEFDSGGGVAGGNVAVTFTAGVATAAAESLRVALNTADTATSFAAAANERFIINASSNTRIDIRNTLTAGVEPSALDIAVNAVGAPTSVRQSGAVDGFIIRDLDLVASATAGIVFNGQGVPTTFNVDDIDIAMINGSTDLSVDFNFGTVNQADGLVQFAAAYNPTFIDTDGAGFGQFSGVTIGEDGLVTALFENGDIRPVFKIPVATFPNPGGLGANTGNVFTQTDFSGLFFLRTAGTGGAGKVQNSVLEASTVDIAKEFTQMITTQRAFSASAKILTTADEMLDDLVRIKR